LVTLEKKEFLYAERTETKRQEYLTALSSINANQIVYVDESGFDPREKYAYGWSPIGEKIVDDKKGKRSKRINMISALDAEGNLFAPFVFEGSCNTEIFNIYVSQVLVPSLKEGAVVIIDNASFHKSSVVKEHLKTKQADLLFLPPYSPDLNPIEKYWGPIKNDLKKKFREAIDDPIGTVGGVLSKRSI
jgi:transposase